MRIQLLTGASILASLLLTACGDSGSTATTSPAASTQQAEPMKVGLLVTGSTSDGGWNQLAVTSLNALATADNLSIVPQQQVTKDTAPDRIRQMDSQDFGVVIAHGYEYLDAAKELTDPTKGSGVKVKIAVSGGDVDNPNFASLDYDLSGASYQLGIIAAKVSKTGKLGFIGGAPYPTVTAMKRGFEAGAKSINPAITVAAQYTGWDDPSKAKKQAEAFMEQGIDVIMQNVDAASRGVFEAVQEHNAGAGKGSTAYTFGANSDQNANPVCPDYTLASAVIKMDLAFDRVIQQVKEGKFKGGLVKEDLASGVSVAVINPKLMGKVIDASVPALLDEAAKKLASGEVTIPAN
ncbi:MAG TPA: BMP family protein [Phycisphaerae bacterium]|nr:BMP family protein [Phycisphaerae bacterium]